MRTGIYALLDVTGAPLDPADCRVLGMAPEEGQCVAMAGHDAELGGQAVSRAVIGSTTAILVGSLSDPDSDASPAAFACQAWLRHGQDLALHLDGEWSLLLWDAATRELVVAISWATRDPVHFASDGRRVAVAPAMADLLRLSWVDGAIDARAFSLHLAQAALRQDLGAETPFAAIRRVPPGGVEVFGARRASLSCGEPESPEPFRGSFEDALAAFDTLMLANMQRLYRDAPDMALLLSGGLDSSTLAVYAARARGSGGSLTALCSAAGIEGSKADELHFAGLVSQALGFPLHPVASGAETNVYLPSSRMMAHNEIPVASPRHYQYEAFHRRAEEAGVRLVLDGSYGEGSITYAPPPTDKAGALRQLYRTVRKRLRPYPGEQWPRFTDQFHARLAPAVLRELETSGVLGPIRRATPRASQVAAEEARFGYVPAMRKNAMTPTSTPAPGLRHVYPFRERNLLRLMASMPGAFVTRDGGDRVIARSLIAPHLPPEIVHRPKSGDLEPGYAARFALGAGAVLERLPGWRRGSAGDWLDLGWLERQIEGVRAGKDLPMRQLHRVQCTTVACAWFDWVDGLSRTDKP